jgi:hypothetical protein
LPPNAEWLSNRLEKFRTYCLPSVVAQSNQNFRWHLYFCDRAPAECISQVRSLIEPYPNIEIKICDLFTKEVIQENVRNALAPETKWVLTTRLDNDDGWHRDFVKRLQGQLEFKRSEFLNFPRGIILYDNKIFLYKHTSNAFISFLEPRDDFLTVWCGTHLNLGKIAPIRQLVESPTFLQVVHDQTRSNKPRGVRVRRLPAIEGFEAIPELFEMSSPESDLGILWENLTAASVWAARDQAIALARGAARTVVSTGLGGTRVADLLRPLTADY